MSSDLSKAGPEPRKNVAPASAWRALLGHAVRDYDAVTSEDRGNFPDDLYWPKRTD